jgi:hypothetical protein
MPGLYQEIPVNQQRGVVGGQEENVEDSSLPDAITFLL